MEMITIQALRRFYQMLRCVLPILLIMSLASCSSTGSKRGAGADGEHMGLSELDLAARREARFADGSIPAAEGEGMFRDVRFAFDAYDIGDSARQNIDYNVEVLRQNPSLRVMLEGHCDERGTSEYNLALGERRARAVRDMLISHGISPARLQTISYGEEIPLVQGSNEEAWAMNRRVHFSPLP